MYTQLVNLSNHRLIEIPTVQEGEMHIGLNGWDNYFQALTMGRPLVKGKGNWGVSVLLLKDLMKIDSLPWLVM